MTLQPEFTHRALTPLDGQPHPECGQYGRCVIRMAEVDCPDCLQLDADRHARTEIHDGHAIPADDEPDLVPSLVERLEQLERIVTELYERLEQMGAARAHEDVMSPGDVQEMLGISGKTLDSWVKKGLIPFIPLPSGHRRYLRTVVEAMLRQGTPK